MELILLSASASFALLVAELADYIAVATRRLRHGASHAEFAPQAQVVAGASEMDLACEASSGEKSELDQAA
jgi:hypothetical protein